MISKHKISILLIIAFTVCIAAVALCCIVFPSEVSAAYDSDTEALIAINNQIAEYKKELQAIAKKQSSLSSKITAAKENKQESVAAKLLIEEQIVTLLEEQTYLEQYAESLQYSIGLLSSEIDDTQKKYDDYYEIYKSRIRANYENGVLTYLEIFLTAKSFTELLTRIDYAAYMINYDKTLLKNMETALKSIKESRLDLELKMDEAVSTAEDLTVSIAKLNDAMADCEAQLALLNADLSSYYSQQQKYNDLEADIDAQIADLKNKQAAYTGGFLIWPVPGYSRISSDFGWRTLYGQKDWHNGIDIPAPKGTNIVAANAGTVIMAEWVNTGGGLKIMIDHGGNLNTIYCHCSKLLVEEGDIVKQGDVIAHVGTTGNSTGNHLHFGVYKNKEYLDPEKYVNYENDPTKNADLF